MYKSILDIADHVPALVAMYNIQTGQYLYVNKSVKKLLGYSVEEFMNGGLSFVVSLVHPDDLSSIMEKNKKALEKANKSPKTDDEPIVTFEYRLKHKDGTWRWVQTNGSVYGRNKSGEVESILNISVDITDRKSTEEQLLESQKEIILSKETERRLKESEQRFRNLVEAVEDYAIFALDESGMITSWNGGVETILGYEQDEIIGQYSEILFTREDREAGIPAQELKQVKSLGRIVSEGLRLRKDGSVFHAIVNVTAIYDEHGKFRGFSKIMRDVTEKKEAEETIRYQAYHDPLTGLANRKALDERYMIAQSEVLQDKKNKIAILFLDLDRFKNINDTLGHGFGDMILKEVANRLTSALKPEDTVARLGGDEFILLLKGIQHAKEVGVVCEKILQALEPVIRVRNHSLHITASIGIAVSPEDGQDIFTLLKNADTALYRAKDTGRNRYQFYNPRMNLLSIERLSLEQDLRSAMRRKELEIVYQPFVEITTGKVRGVEALLRWNHSKLGMLYPSEFIPLAEEIGAIVPIGKWLLTTICRQGKRWHDQGIYLKLTANLSAHQFAEQKIVETVKDVLKESRLEPQFLELEITESVAMQNIGNTSSKLLELKQSGVNIAIDDFGTGYSSLSYLKNFPVHKLKIDKTFISNAVADSQDSAIIRAIISMGNSLGLEVCVEGIEKKEQLDLLASMECAFAQGYFICEPLSVEQLTVWLRALEVEEKLPQVVPLLKKN